MLASSDICQRGFVIAMVAVVLVPNKYNAITNHHADTTMNILSHESHCVTQLLCLKQFSVRKRPGGRQSLFPLLITMSSSLGRFTCSETRLGITSFGLRDSIPSFSTRVLDFIVLDPLSSYKSNQNDCSRILFLSGASFTKMVFYPSMDKKSHVQKSVEWITNHPEVYNGCNYLSMLSLRLTYISKKGSSISQEM